MKSLSKVNWSTWFIYPLFQLDSAYDNYLENTYAYHNEYKDLLEHFYIVFNFSGRITEGRLYSKYIENPYLELEERLRKHECWFSDYDLDHGSKVLFILQIPDRFLKDYKLILEGKYSQISEEAKRIILKRYEQNENLKGILYKTSFWKNKYQNSGIYLSGKIEIPEDQEYWSKLDETKETFYEKQTQITTDT